ncbi:hypothetical protein Ctob_007991 [Chrysochromulina tobinii]|uniref:OTU domain-containing protein n=1 Tax=Chrysochromulina tobinii TaxID=1460289 RepID=A0A0M0K5T6_9EUKA|nr:hypothetical protein Ctob_007991 [Chrysochromulina tobinii]|eukprot:KOO34190.1 hypothetical protein Ctob_007991 [Chrysochromulina sp. CCMP291]
MAGQPKLATSLHATRTDESIKRSTIPPSTAIDVAKPRAPPTANLKAAADTHHAADDLSGTRAKVPGDGTFLFHAVSKSLKLSDTANHTAQQTIITDSARSSAFWAKNTIAKTHAAVTAAPQAAEPPGTATSRAVRTMEMRQRRNTSPTTVIINGDMDLFTGKPKRVDKDGDCFFSASLAMIVHSEDKKQVRGKISAWLKAHPNTPLQSCTLSEHVMYETGEVWSAYCARMQHEHTWAGLPELVAASQVWHRTIRVFVNVGDGLFNLRAVLGEEGFSTTPVDLVLESDHYDVLTEARPLKTTPHETIAQGRTAESETIIDERNECEPDLAELDPIATLTLELRALDKLKELELFSKTAMTNKEIAARVVRNELAARKELKQLEERMARERHAMRKKLTERKTSEQLTEPEIEHKAPEQLTEPKTECKAPEHSSPSPRPSAR